jgi:predicted transcriptional regulator
MAKKMTTTIKLHQETKVALDSFRERPSETYDEVINKLVYIAEHVEDEPELSEETIRAISAAKKRIAAGYTVSIEEVTRRLGLKCTK